MKVHDLTALPAGTVIRDAQGTVFERQTADQLSDDLWLVMGDEEDAHTDRIQLPVQLLWVSGGPLNVLVTGSSGFIGRHICAALTERGDLVRRIDMAETIDCLDTFRYDTRRYDLAIHCAAHVGGRAGIDGSPLAVATNLALDAWFFRWLELSGTPRAVYFSSSAAYPLWHQTGDYPAPLKEDILALDITSVAGVNGPDQTYGLCKVVGERLAAESSAAVHVFRPFSGYGGDQDPAYPFRAFIDRARRRDDPFEVWGDGTQVRDWIHVDDIVAAVFAAIDADERGPVNLCTGQGTAMGDLAELVCEMAGYSPAFKFLPGQPTGVRYRVGDPSRMLRFYTPKVALHEGVRRALELA